MTDLTKDPIVNAIHNGIKGGINVTVENKCFGSAVILIYSGMDTMAYLNMPLGQEEVTKRDFVEWVEKYIHFPCTEQLTGLDLYGARCSTLHRYGVVSRLSKEGKCRQVGYMDHSRPEVLYNPDVNQSLVLVSVEALRDAFFKGVDRFLIDVFGSGDCQKIQILEQRLKTLFQSFPYKKDTSGDAAF